MKIPVGVSGRHLHLSPQDLEVLFGSNRALQQGKALSQTSQFAAMERVTLVGPKGEVPNVRVLGPTRQHTQVEISLTDAIKLGINPPVRESGDLTGADSVCIQGPRGEVGAQEAVIVAWRHIHMTAEDALILNVKDNDKVSVGIDGPRGGVMHQVIVRVRPDFVLELHIDTDEANAFGLKDGDYVEICTPNLS